jgi:phosphatidylinositol-3-phosphatase
MLKKLDCQKNEKDRVTTHTEIGAATAPFYRRVTHACAFLAVALISCGCGTVQSSKIQSSPLTVAVTSPASGATVAGTVMIVATASAGASSVQFVIDNKSAGSAVSTAPFSYSLNTTTLANGSHSLAAVASNAAGQTATSAAVRITVNNSHLQITTSSLPAGQVGTAYSATMQATGGTAPYAWKVSGGLLPAGVMLSTDGILSGTPTLSGSFSVTVSVADSAGLSTSSMFSIAITIRGSPLTVAVTSPAPGATVAGTIMIVATASAGASSVQFLIDGKSAGSPVSTAPFSFSLNTTTLANGSHSLAAAASNLAGQTATSAAVPITVNNSHLQITTSSLPSGQVGTSYSSTLQATGGTAPYAWTISGGQLPAGVNLSSGGVLSGTPTLSGSFTVTVSVADSAGLSASSTFSIAITATTPPPSSPFGHVVIVVEENTDYSAVIGNSSAPYLNTLANQYGLATQYYANTHPSIGNYFVLATGQTLTNDDSQTPLSFPVSVDNVVRELVAAGKTWRGYAESIPAVGYVGGDATGPDGGQFYTRHMPLPYMTDVQDNTVQRQNIVPFTQFAVDLSANALPDYSFITPNGCDDAHDCGLAVADTWLETNIDPLIKSPMFQKDGLLIILFDESGSDNTNGGGRVAAILISPFSKLGFKSTTMYQHQSVLRLMLEGLGVTAVPAPASAAPVMWEFFTFTPPA